MSSEPAREAELVSGHEAFRQILAKLLTAASHDLALLSERLEPRLYAHPQVIDALQQFALKTNRRRIRILVANPRMAVADGNSLLELARRLPSRIELREVAEEQRGVVHSERLLVDAAAQMLERLSPEYLEASYYAHPSPRTLQCLKEFEVLWEAAQPSLELSGLK